MISRRSDPYTYMRNGMNLILCFQVKQRAQQHDENAKSCDDYLRQIGYREYSRYLSFHFPFTHERSLLEHLRATPWRFDHRHFKVKTHLSCACQSLGILPRTLILADVLMVLSVRDAFSLATFRLSSITFQHYNIGMCRFQLTKA